MSRSRSICYDKDSRQKGNGCCRCWKNTTVDERNNNFVTLNSSLDTPNCGYFQLLLTFQLSADLRAFQSTTAQVLKESFSVNINNTKGPHLFKQRQATLFSLLSQPEYSQTCLASKFVQISYNNNNTN